MDSDGVEKESLSLFALFTEKDDTMSNHISDGSLVIAAKVAGSDDKVLYPVANHLGSTIMTTDSQGQVLSKTVHDPFGNVWSQNEDTEQQDTEQQERQFTNQVYDKETGLYYFNMRYYDPQLGMFISPDPAMSGFNHYAYASGNPVHFNDPSGLVDVDGDEVPGAYVDYILSVVDLPNGGYIYPDELMDYKTTMDFQWEAGAADCGIDRSHIETSDPSIFNTGDYADYGSSEKACSKCVPLC